jgi:hypothetical protein
MFGLAIALLTYGITLWAPVQVPHIVESLITPTSHPKQQRLHTQATPSPIPTRTPTIRPNTPHTVSDTTEKSQALNTASGKTIPAVAGSAIEHSPVLEPCTQNCNPSTTHTPTPTPTEIPTPTPTGEPKIVFPTIHPTNPPCDWDYKITRDNPSGKPDFVEIPVIPCPL